MGRLERLLKLKPSEGPMIEVAPYFNPALPKSSNPDVLIVDVFDTETLRARALEDGDIPNNRIREIEPVDIVGDASDLARLVEDRGIAGRVSYIVSSHNFEHLPDPIRFLRGAQSCLRPGGILSMAIPDCRATFDHFRSPIRLVDWLAAYHDARQQPNADTIFDLHANRATYRRAGIDGLESVGCNWHRDDPGHFALVGDLKTAYADWLDARTAQGGYKDAHVSVVTPGLFRLLIEDLRYLGLIDLEVVEVSETNSFEFYAHLRRPLNPVGSAAGAEDYPHRRVGLLHAVADEIGNAAFPGRRAMFPRFPRWKDLLRGLLGTGPYMRLRAWNRRRLAARRG